LKIIQNNKIIITYLLEVGTGLLKVANPPRGATAMAVGEALSIGRLPLASGWINTS